MGEIRFGKQRWSDPFMFLFHSTWGLVGRWFLAPACATWDNETTWYINSLLLLQLFSDVERHDSDKKWVCFGVIKIPISSTLWLDKNCSAKQTDGFSCFVYTLPCQYVINYYQLPFYHPPNWIGVNDNSRAHLLRGGTCEERLYGATERSAIIVQTILRKVRLISMPPWRFLFLFSRSDTHLGIVMHLVWLFCVLMAFSRSCNASDFFSFFTRLFTAFSVYLWSEWKREEQQSMNDMK